MAEDNEIGVCERAMCPRRLVVLCGELGKGTVRVVFAIQHDCRKVSEVYRGDLDNTIRGVETEPVLTAQVQSLVSAARRRGAPCMRPNQPMDVDSGGEG